MNPLKLLNKYFSPISNETAAFYNIFRIIQMNNIKLFKISKDGAEELDGYFANLERELQTLVERHLQKLFGVSLLAREYSTGASHPGQIDSLGLDENFCPVIIEFKRRSNENVITQGLYYLDWLLDHEAEFRALAAARLGPEIAGRLEFAGSRVLCIASGFSRYDEKAVKRIGRRVELIRYKFFAEDLIMFETRTPDNENLILSLAVKNIGDRDAEEIGIPAALRARINNMTDSAEDLYMQLLSFAESLGEDVGIKFLKHYIALTRLKNFTSIQPMKNFLKIWVNLDPADVALEEGFSRDVSNVGHHSSGNIEIDIHDREELEKAKILVERAYLNN